jgi:predicted GIY-YIG superfamily endonuclease
MDNPNKNYTIYVLQCRDNRYYVGKTQHPNFRLDQHFNHNGSQWTIRYPPIKVIKLIENCDSFDEDKYTRILMSQFGIDNVRGGSFCQIELPSEIKKHLEKEIQGAKDQCFYCGKSGHFIRNCKEYKKEKEDESNDWGFVDLVISNTKRTDNKIKKKEKKIEKEDTCKKCGRRGHIKLNCFAVTHNDGTIIKNNICSRCGRSGHNIKNCYAKTDINGNWIK